MAAAADTVGSSIDWKSRTVNVILLAKDLENKENQAVFDVMNNQLTYETLMKEDNPDKIQDPLLPVCCVSETTFDEFVRSERDGSSAFITLLVMTELADQATMNATYSKARGKGMCVAMVLPPEKDGWCGMIDVMELSERDESSKKTEDLFNDEIMDLIKQNQQCRVGMNHVQWWFGHTYRSVYRIKKSSEIRELYDRYDLLKKPQWVFSGIPLHPVSYFPAGLGISYDQIWKIEECSLGDHLTTALFTRKNELFLSQSSLIEDYADFKVIDLNHNDFQYTLIDQDLAQCNIGKTVSFKVKRTERGMPVRYQNNPRLDIELLRNTLLNAMKEEDITEDSSLRMLVDEAVGCRNYCFEQGILDFSDEPVINSEFHCWINSISSLLFRSVRFDMPFLPKILGVLQSIIHRDGFSQSLRHWTDVFSNAVFRKLKNRTSLFKKCLLSVGLGINSKGYSALDWAAEKGDSELVTAAIAFEKGLSSQSSLEDEMAEKYSRWSAQSEHFVKEYILRRGGKKGSECLKFLSDATMRFIKDRGDITAVDLIGVIWHSNEASKSALLKRLMMALVNTLDYDTISKDHSGWLWVRDSVMKHPIWLSTHHSSSAGGRAAHEKDGDDGDGKESDSTIVKKKKILFDLLKTHCDDEASIKGGSVIKEQFQSLIAKEPEQWAKLTAFEPSIPASMILRQDQIELGTKAGITKEELDEITLRVGSLDFDAAKLFDSRKYLTDLVMNAHFVQPHFESLMKEALSPFGKVSIGPVKTANRVLPKSEEYASEGHRCWPYAACVIDVVRCSVTLNTLSELMTAMQGFEQFISSNDCDLSCVRCKNGFSQFKDSDEIPDCYADVKYNISCRDSNGERAVIGEVQFLLDCVVKSKSKGHDLYEVSRSSNIYNGAALRLDKDYSMQRQLLLTVDSPLRMSHLLAFYPFRFNLEHLDFELLFRSKWTNRMLIRTVANAIYRNGVRDVKALMDAMMSSITTLPAKPPLPIGVASLMCEIVSMEGTDKDCIQLIQRLFKERERRCVIRALIGLDARLKRKIVFDGRIAIRSETGAFRDVSADDLVSAFQGWKDGSEIPLRDMVHKLSATIGCGWRETDSKVTRAYQGFYELDPKGSLEYWKSHRGQIPDYMIKVLRESRESHPKMVQAFVDAELVSGELLIGRV